MSVTDISKEELRKEIDGQCIFVILHRSTEKYQF